VKRNRGSGEAYCHGAVQYEAQHRNLRAALRGNGCSICTSSISPGTGHRSDHLSRRVGAVGGNIYAVNTCAGLRQHLLSPGPTTARASSQAHDREREYRTDRSRCGGAKDAVAGYGVSSFGADWRLCRAPRPAEFVPATVPDDRFGRLPKIKGDPTHDGSVFGYY